MNDQIFIEGIEIETRIGAFKEERKQSQKLILHISLITNLKAPAESDNLDDTLNYDTIISIINQIARSNHGCQLLESFTQRIVLAILEIPTKLIINEISLRIEKPNARQNAKSIGINMTYKPEMLGEKNSRDS